MSRQKKNHKQLQAMDEKKLAFERLAPERQALREEELVRINVDASNAATIVLDTLPKIAELLPELRRLHGFDASIVAGLADRAKAVLFAESMGLRRRVRVRLGRRELTARARALRFALLTQARELHRWNVIDFDSDGKISEGRRLSDIAKDLTLLSDLLRTQWGVIAGRTPVTLDDLTEADELGDRMFGAISPVRKVDPQADVRARAFTLLTRSYEQVRRAVAYLRWNESDAERFAPTLYLGRTRKSATTAEVASPSPPVPAAPPTPAPPPVV